MVMDKNTFFDGFYSKELVRLEKENLLRTLPVAYGTDRVIEINGTQSLNFCSNNYLNLANHTEVIKAAKDAMDKYGVGSGASRLVTGTFVPHIELEDKISEFKGTTKTLLFNSGYHANLGVISALADRDSEIFMDKLNHASIIDGAILSRATITRYPHKDVEYLEEKLKNSKSKKKFVITDGVFSMDGDFAPLNDILYTANKYDAMVIVDDAHGTGATGKYGKGTLDALNIKAKNVIQIGTLGKAIGTFGAFVTGDLEIAGDVIDYIKNTARSFIYTTSLPPALCMSSIRAIELIDEEPMRRGRLWDNGSYLKEELRLIGCDIGDSETQIMPVIVGEDLKALALRDQLLKDGIFVQAIRTPSVPKDSARLRITVMSEHKREDLDKLVESLKKHL